MRSEVMKEYTCKRYTSLTLLHTHSCLVFSVPLWLKLLILFLVVVVDDAIIGIFGTASGTGVG